jgi:hypothetical protein
MIWEQLIAIIRGFTRAGKIARSLTGTWRFNTTTHPSLLSICDEGNLWLLFPRDILPPVPQVAEEKSP